MDIKPPIKRRPKSPVVRPPQQIPRKTFEPTKPLNTDRPRSRIGSAIERVNSKADFSGIKEAVAFKQIILGNKLIITNIAAVSILVFFLYLFRIASLPKSTALDSAAALGVQSFTNLSNNIVFGPQKFLDYLLFKLNLASAVSFRLASILFTVFALVLFFLIIKRWFSAKVSVLATLLFATSTWTLIQTRDSNFINSFFIAIPALFFIGYLIRRKPQSIWIIPLVFFTACLMYIPGIIWFIVFAAAIYYKNIRELFGLNQLNKNIALAMTFILPILPMLYFMVKNPPSFNAWLGLPPKFSFELQTILDNLSAIPGQLFVAGLDQPLLWLFGSPLIDAATGVLALAGMICAAKDSLHPIRRIALGGFSLITVGLAAVGGSVYISLLLPLIYVFAAYGIYYLLEQWYSTFPRNPVARSIGYILMCLLVLCVCFYHVSRYFIVWPRNDRVIQSFESVSSDTIDKRYNNKFYLDKE